MNSEKAPAPRIPEENRLPLKISEQEHIAESGESSVWSAAVQDSAEQERLIALKQIRREAFASDEEMRASKEFYDFLKGFPGFGAFVPDTLYFKARMTADSAPQAFAIQPFMEGRSIDQISDEELYKDPELAQQLLEFAKASVEILQKTREQKTAKPDFGTSVSAGEKAYRYGNLFSNARYSTNIVITDAPDKNGQRVFFVDTGVNPNQRSGSPTQQVIERQVHGRIREFNFNRWITKLEKILNGNHES